jgi:hypothetical protein
MSGQFIARRVRKGQRHLPCLASAQDQGRLDSMGLAKDQIQQNIEINGFIDFCDEFGILFSGALL